jgi:protein TonB
MSTVHIQIDDQSLKGPLLGSILLHAMLFGTFAISTLLSHTGNGWGGSTGGGAISVKLVGGLNGVPLPQPDAVTTNRVVDPTKGLYKSEPQPKPQPAPLAKEIPEFKKEKRPRYVTRPSKVLEDDAQPPQNAVPYGQGGSPTVPYSQFALGTGGGATTGGLGFSGTGGGDFGSKFSWYVDAVRSRVSSNWLQSTVDPSLRWAPRAVLAFDVLRNGAVANVQILQSSGNATVDNSAVRAILGSSPLNPLPNEYGGNKVSVEFWFDFRR